MQVALSVFSIVGVVFGSGFISGKEIVVYFSKFGYISLPLLLIVLALFFIVFKILLEIGDRVYARLKNNKISFLINIISSIIFAAAMFGADRNLLNFDNFYIKIVGFLIIFALCLLIFKKGIKSLNKLNLFLIPFSILIFVYLLAKKMDFSSSLFTGSSQGAAPFYSLLYVALNLSTGAVLIASLGRVLTKKQKAQASFLSALVLCLVLLIANVVLLQNPYAFSAQMPLLSLFKGQEKIILNTIVLIGCNTTLLTLVYSISSSMRGLCKNEILIFVTSIIVPYFCSFLGFGFIVTYLYPLASTLGVLFLLDLIFVNREKLFFKPLFKRTDKKVHSGSKDTK